MNPPLRLGLVGPLPPPSGGMAMQTLQLARLLREEGVTVHLVQTNAPYRPAFVEKLKLIRALFRLIPYIWKIWRMAARVDVVHLMANSGWSWQLFSAPVIWIGWLRKTPVIVNYRGGEAREYLLRSGSRIKPTLAKASRVVVPSGFLQEVFNEFGVNTEIIPNIIDLDTFFPVVKNTKQKGQYTIVITRNLEPIYGINSAIRSIAIARQAIPGIALKIAGSGPQLEELQQLVDDLQLGSCVSFVGRLARTEIVALYQSADAMLNPSTVDNMPNSVLEALACGLPVVSTNVGGVPHMVENGVTALLVDSGDVPGMARAIESVCSDEALVNHLRTAGLQLVDAFAWPRVKEQWLALYCSQGVAA